LETREVGWSASNKSNPMNSHIPSSLVEKRDRTQTRGGLWPVNRLGALVILGALLSGTAANGADVPQGGTYVPLAPSTLQCFTARNTTGKDVYDIHLTWCDRDGKPKPNPPNAIVSYSDDGQKDNKTATSRASMDTPGMDPNGRPLGTPNNPIVYRVGQTTTGQKPEQGGETSRRLANGQSLTVTNGFGSDAVPAGTDLMYVAFSDKNGAIIQPKESFHPKANDAAGRAYTLDGGDYRDVMLWPLDHDYYSFTDLEDASGVVALHVPTSSSHTLVELLSTDGVTVLAAAAGSTDLVLVQPLGPAGTYYVRVSNPVEEATYSVHQSINYVESEPPRIVTQPLGGTYVAGETVSWRVVVDSQLPVRYQWQKDGHELVGQTEAALTLANLRLSDAGDYRALIENAAGRDDHAGRHARCARTHSGHLQHGRGRYRRPVASGHHRRALPAHPQRRPPIPGPHAWTLTAGPVPPWLDEGPNSRWIAPRPDQRAEMSPPGLYIYQTSFRLEGIDLATVKVVGRLAADDALAQARLNGTILSGLPGGGFSYWQGFEIASGFVQERTRSSSTWSMVLPSMPTRPGSVWS